MIQAILDNQKDLLRYAYHLTGNMADAEDIAQESNIKLLSKNIDTNKNVKGYILTTCKHVFIDRNRANNVNIVELSEMPVYDKDDNYKTLLSFIRRQDNSKGKSYFLLFFVYKLRYKDIAECLDVSISSVKTNIHRFRKTIQSKLCYHSYK